MNKKIKSMEEEESFDLLFNNVECENIDIVLPLIRKCISMSSNEKEVLRALEIALCFCLKTFSVSELEVELFQIACPPAGKIVISKLKYLETHPSYCVESLSISIKIMSFFQEVFKYLNEINKIAINEVESLLIATSEILLNCLTHCKISENVYGVLFSSLTDHLSDFFKKCCELLECLLNFLTDKIECDVENERGILLLDKIMTFLSNCGFILINLEVKTMAKLWKVFVSLTERYLNCLKNNHNIGETIKKLCHNIMTSVETVFYKDNQDFNKIIKLSCFFLKLTIKFSEAFVGHLNNCQNTLLSLLLMLCKCSSSLIAKEITEININQDLMNHLTAGTDPLLSQLLLDERFVMECHEISKDLKKSAEFSILCCLIMKKLLDKNSITRRLWFNEKQNILEWIFLCSSSSQFIVCYNISLPDILIYGKSRKFTDLYEFVFTTTSAFLMTSSSDEFRLVEEILTKNVLQENPIRALLAIDIWCILAKFADSELSFTQILALGKIFQEFHPENLRVEKWYLASLICRLYPLLIDRHRSVFLKSFPSPFYSALWRNSLDNIAPNETSDVIRILMDETEQLLDQKDSKSAAVELQMLSKQQNTQLGSFESRIIKWWKFNCEILSCCPQYSKFLKTVCALTALTITYMPSENLITVLKQMKKLLAIRQPACVKMYIMNILKSLSAVNIPSDDSQKKTLTTIAEIFRDLLLSKNALVKQKAMETFYTFSHITSHGEVIPLTVQNCHELQLEVINCFKKKFPDQNNFSLNNYFDELYQLKFEHVCQKVESDAAIIPKEFQSSPIDLENITMRWKKDTKRIIECFKLLSESQKRDINNVCASLFPLLRSSTTL